MLINTLAWCHICVFTSISLCYIMMVIIIINWRQESEIHDSHCFCVWAKVIHIINTSLLFFPLCSLFLFFYCFLSSTFSFFFFLSLCSLRFRTTGRVTSCPSLHRAERVLQHGSFGAKIGKISYKLGRIVHSNTGIPQNVSQLCQGILTQRSHKAVSFLLLPEAQGL